MPQWGRPSGAKGSRRRRQWEQDQGQWQQSRVEELDSEGDTDTHRVGLHLGEKRFASDPLHFTGIDISNTRPRRGYSYDESQRSSESDSDSEDSDYQEGDDRQLALRGDKEEAIVQGALARIRRAQEKGRQDVRLTQEELDALERRRIRMQAAAAAKAARKEKGSSGGGAEKKRRSDRKTVDIASLLDPRPTSEPRKRKSKSKSGGSSHHSPSAGPGIIVDGPQGPSYTPIGAYHPSDRDTSRSRSSPRHGGNSTPGYH
ncbi:9a552ce1-1496-4e86-b0fc-1dd6e738f32b [Sclerotinia trifoliorum]|uniref:9a552ce1-1496-4e86-b0fc-1dd6e738f32b n=1 Tax=Sclerotinia trifoliorum TaxID=28548 RepID=A0A8H2W037_9HELO|nr:9a552ce1-1496-4e86-b0fc-1dd6e738f32b [Sclerotinia trifoliorum]